MKKQLLIIAAAGLIIYFLLRKKYFNQKKSFELEMKPYPGEHHLTNVFSKAKKYSTGKA